MAVCNTHAHEYINLSLLETLSATQLVMLLIGKLCHHSSTTESGKGYVWEASLWTKLSMCVNTLRVEITPLPSTVSKPEGTFSYWQGSAALWRWRSKKQNVWVPPKVASDSLWHLGGSKFCPFRTGEITSVPCGDCSELAKRSAILPRNRHVFPSELLMQACLLPPPPPHLPPSFPEMYASNFSQRVEAASRSPVEVLKHI